MVDLEVRATIKFQDLQPGDVVLVDPADPYIAKLLRAGWLVPVESPSETRGDDP
jgi:hypothetical protein